MKNSKTCFLFYSLLAIILGLLQGCTHYYYGPNSNNIPLLQQKDDIRVGGALGMASETSGFELQSAYAVSNHFGTMFNFYGASGKRNSGSNSSYSKGSGTYAEIGGGYFAPFGPTKNWIFETYAGAGTGGINNSYSQTESSKVNATKLFIQPSIGFSDNSGILQAAISSRFSSVHLKVQQSSISKANTPDEYDAVQDIKNNANNIFWEPSFLFRAGYNKIYLQMQYTSSSAFNKHLYLTQDGILSLGLFFSLNAKSTK